MPDAAVNFMIDMYSYNLDSYDFGSVMHYEPSVSKVVFMFTILAACCITFVRLILSVLTQYMFTHREKKNSHFESKNHVSPE